jgi:CheY-like chemotaxis protein
VEDDEVDIENLSRAFQKIHLPVELHIAQNGIEALNELYEEPDKQDFKLFPDLIIIDINMPKMDGIEFLKELRKDEALDETKILVFTTSDNIKDKRETSKFHVAGYLMKPVQLHELMGACKSLKNIPFDKKFNEE